MITISKDTTNAELQKLILEEKQLVHLHLQTEEDTPRSLAYFASIVTKDKGDSLLVLKHRLPKPETVLKLEAIGYHVDNILFKKREE